MSTILAAVGIGVLVSLAGNVPFNLLRAVNLQVGVALPWAVLPAGLYLWAYWQFIGGRLSKGASAEKRRESPPLVWDSGADAHFVLTAIASAVFVAATAVSYIAVRRWRLAERPPALGARIQDRETVPAENRSVTPA